MHSSSRLFLVILLLISFRVYSQKNVIDPKYRRSSMYTLMIDDSTREHAAAIKEAFISYPVPDKFDNHNLSNRLILSKAAVEDQTVPIGYFLNTNGIAKQLVAKWFNRNAQGAFNMDLVAARGNYNASEMDASIAKLSKRGAAMLADAGEELIKNTFVLVNDFRYKPMEEIVKETRETANKINGVLSKTKFNLGGLDPNAGLLKAAGDVFSNGYAVLTTSYLYRLVWNDSVAAVFYNDYWTDSLHLDPKKVAAFDSSTIFKLEFVGKEKGWSAIPTTIYSQKSDDQLIFNSTIQGVDVAIAKLQKHHEEFRTKTALYTTDTLSAKIGLKEGLEGGDQYQVMELVQNEDGRTEYKKMGVIRVDRNQIWDNRYMATGDSIKPVDRTLFKGPNKDYYPGMLIRQK
ncbi:MAG TPA: hypothetical protein PKK99_00785 [Bacteroidia bacterium]|nr:hypothetical protein [Bacteroidia bacterium]HNP97555.1 hypothetical protein [Bacteroidia bacterium]